MKNFNVGDRVMTHLGPATVLEVIQPERSWFPHQYRVKSDAYGKERILGQIHLSPIVNPGTEVIYEGQRRVVTGHNRFGYTLENQGPHERYVTNVSVAPKMQKLSRKEYKRVKEVWTGSDFPNCIEDENGPLVVPQYASYSYFWTTSRRSCYPAHSVEWVD